MCSLRTGSSFFFFVSKLAKKKKLNNNKHLLIQVEMRHVLHLHMYQWEVGFQSQRGGVIRMSMPGGNKRGHSFRSLKLLAKTRWKQGLGRDEGRETQPLNTDPPRRCLCSPRTRTAAESSRGFWSTARRSRRCPSWRSSTSTRSSWAR